MVCFSIDIMNPEASRSRDPHVRLGLHMKKIKACASFHIKSTKDKM